MDLTTIILTAFIGAVCNVLLIIWLYSYWIIPAIVERVRADLMTNIQQWIESTRDDLRNTISINIDDMKEKVVKTISGYRGNKARQLSLASQFLTANLENPDDLDNEQSEDVITEAISRYGEKIVKAALKSLTTEKASADLNPSAAVW